jgi:hypothetical protein
MFIYVIIPNRILSCGMNLSLQIWCGWLISFLILLIDNYLLHMWTWRLKLFIHLFVIYCIYEIMNMKIDFDSRYKVYSVINFYIIDERYFYQNENNLLANTLKVIECYFQLNWKYLINLLDCIYIIIIIIINFD